VRGQFHCFTGSPADLQRVLDAGSLVSFTGIVTFKNAHTVRQSLAAAPSGQFFFETDSPYLAPEPYRGRRCEPAYVREIAAQGARARGCSLEELSRQTCQAACDFFPKLIPDDSVGK
jgi:TatD DNase family protein